MPKKSSFLLNVGSMTSAGVIGGGSAGIFWIVAARRFPLSVIGIAGAVASVAAVINVVTSLGFTGALIQNVPTRRGNGGLMVAGATASAVLSLAGSGVAVLFFTFFSHKSYNSFTAGSLMLVLALLSGATPIGLMSDVAGAPLGNVWLAPVRAVLMGILRLVFVFEAPLHRGAYGLDMAFALPIALTSVASITFLSVQLYFQERDFWPSRDQRRSYWHFSLHSLPSTMILTVLPVAPPALAVWIIGARMGAVFYICWNGFVLANLLVASATVLGIAPDVPRDRLVKIVRRIAGACSIAMVLGGPLFLLLYGEKYFHSGWIAISILGLALFPYSQEQLQVTLLRRDSNHGHTTRITLVIGAFGIVGLVIGGLLGAVWTMACGWLVAVSLVLLVGSKISRRGRDSDWFPTFPHL